ncbi:disease resistance protein RPP8-like [Salvia hispanica]|uniref:disease resistance protein RPP8-like n=1 Tax=Salvia hispanica TaxID=49212 RepID=UPI002009D1A9|nr:disease resistance protein RPP8-like [Salvia hispanica]
MAAYGAAVSLKNTIQDILQSSRISLVPPSPQILQSGYEAMVSLQKVMLKLDETSCSKIRTKVNALDERIKEVVWEFEDLLESHYTDQILPQLESESDHLPFSVDMQSLRQSVDFFIERVTEMEAEYDMELLNMPEEEGEPLSSRIDFRGINSYMVGSSEKFELIKDYLLSKGEDDDEYEAERNSLLVTGMAGVGKTTLVKRVFVDPLIQTHFELRAWVKVGRKCEFKETIRCILAQVDPSTHHQMLTQRDDDDNEKLIGLLTDRLKDKKCLIVLDDVWEWDTRLMGSLRIKNVQVLLTSRLRIGNSPIEHVLSLLNKEDSMELLGKKVFDENGFPPYLKEMGKKIAEKCEGLPLMIVTVADLLRKANKSTREELDKSIQNYWTEVANKQHNSVFVDAYNQISEVFFPSYDYLPQSFKMIFLYLGAFPPYRNINPYYLKWYVSAEGFYEQIGIPILDKDISEETVEYFLTILVGVLADWYHLLLFDYNLLSWFSNRECRVHSCWQYLCKKEASKIKFLHVLHSYDEVVKDQRRLSTHSNPLFAIKQVYDSIKSDCSSTVRSLLFYGPVHPYPVPIHAMDFKLLRVLNATRVRSYHIPPEILKLVCLKYLGLACNEELPVSISNLIHLQFLIIISYVKIIKRGAQPYMPMEIWDMQNLKFLQVGAGDLPTPNSDSNAILYKVSSILGVSTKSCTVQILKRIPNLSFLSLVSIGKPYDEDDDSNSLSGLANISEELQNLAFLEYNVLYPDMKCTAMVPLSMFPSCLRTLALSGLGHPWHYMNDIGSMLPNLTTVILQAYAFRGPTWDIESSCFTILESLVIEDTDLVEWRAQQGSLPRLKHLSLRYCYKLKHLHLIRDSSMFTTALELVDCNPLVYKAAAKLPESLFAIRSHQSYL